jgi:hypothetical protein
MWGRDEGDAQGVWILPRDKGAQWGVFYPNTKPDADITEALCTLWETPDLLPALRVYFGAVCQPAVTAGPADEVEAAYPADAPPELVKLARAGRASAGRAEGETATAADLVARLAPKLNGQHPPGE